MEYFNLFEAQKFVGGYVIDYLTITTNSPLCFSGFCFKYSKSSAGEPVLNSSYILVSSRARHTFLFGQNFISDSRVFKIRCGDS